MNRKWILIVILFFWFAQACSISSKNTEYDQIISGLASTSELGECKLSVNVKRSWPFSWTARSASIRVNNQDVALTSFTSNNTLPDRTFLKSHNTKYHFTWSRELEGQLVASFLDIELKPNGEIHTINIGNCSSYTDNNELIGYLEHCNLPVQVLQCS